MEARSAAIRDASLHAGYDTLIANRSRIAVAGRLVMTRPRKGQTLSDETARDRRRLVIGAAYKYGPDQVRVFVESLRATGYTGDVIMLTGRLQWRLKAYLRRHGVRPFPHWSTRRLHGPIQAYRFERFASVLQRAASRYDQAAVADVKDVLFQR